MDTARVHEGRGGQAALAARRCAHRSLRGADHLEGGVGSRVPRRAVRTRAGVDRRWGLGFDREGAPVRGTRGAPEAGATQPIRRERRSVRRHRCLPRRAQAGEAAEAEAGASSATEGALGRRDDACADRRPGRGPVQATRILGAHHRSSPTRLVLGAPHLGRRRRLLRGGTRGHGGLGPSPRPPRRGAGRSGRDGESAVRFPRERSATVGSRGGGDRRADAPDARGAERGAATGVTPRRVLGRSAGPRVRGRVRARRLRLDPAPSRRAAGSWPRCRAQPETLPAAATDGDYSAARDHCAGLRGGAPHQPNKVGAVRDLRTRIVTSYLFPGETAWVDDMAAAFQQTPAVPELAALALACRTSALDANTTVGEEGLAHVPAMVEGFGRDIVIRLESEISYASTRNVDLSVLGEALAAIPTDGAMQALSGWRHLKGFDKQFAVAVSSYPLRAHRLGLR